MNANLYSKPEVLLGDLRGGLCSSGLCKQLRSVAADELERLTRERDEERARWISAEDDAEAVQLENERLRSALERIASQSAKNHEDPEEEAYESRRIAARALSDKPGSPPNQ